jgi:hypothetical protein
LLRIQSHVRLTELGMTLMRDTSQGMIMRHVVELSVKKEKCCPPRYPLMASQRFFAAKGPSRLISPLPGLP